MKYERIYLDGTDKRVFIDTYATTCRGEIRPAILVIPGGGYQGVCSDREGEPIALAFVAHGYNAFVLHYRVGKEGDHFPKQMIDAGKAMIYIREHAEQYYVDPARVFMTGFSAGGHLTGSMATMFDYEEMKAEFGDKYPMIRPTGAILCYPVVSAMVVTHQGSFENLTGKSFAELTVEDKRKFSLECAASEKSAPMFIWHTAEDELVPIAGSLALAEKLASLGLSFKLSVYPYGTHGLALGNEITECGNRKWVQKMGEGWVDEACLWMKTLKDY